MLDDYSEFQKIEFYKDIVSRVINTGYVILTSVDESCTQHKYKTPLYTVFVYIKTQKQADEILENFEKTLTNAVSDLYQN